MAKQKAVKPPKPGNAAAQKAKVADSPATPSLSAQPDNQSVILSWTLQVPGGGDTTPVGPPNGDVAIDLRRYV